MIRRHSQRLNSKGVVLITVLWVVFVLSLIAWGMTRRTSLEISLLETYRGKVRSYAAARAGVSRILDLINKSPSTKDSLYCAGIALSSGQTPENVFSHIDVGKQAYAIVQWSPKGYQTDTADVYGLQDEQGKININAINANNYQILSSLFELKGLSRVQADALTLDIVGYKGSSNLQDKKNWLHKDDGNSSALKAKNKPYEHIMELLEVDGMTKKIFDQIKDDVTIYGDQQNGLWVNLNTATNDVVQALANAAQRVNSAVEINDIVRQSFSIRDGIDGKSFTSDDGTGIVTGDMTKWPPALHSGQSNSSYVRAHVTGVDEDTGIRTVIEAVIQRAGGFTQNKIIGWQRD